MDRIRVARELVGLARSLSVPEQHQKKIAIKTLKMPDAMVGVMGGMNKDEARDFLKSIGYSDSKIRKLEASVQRIAVVKGLVRLAKELAASEELVWLRMGDSDDYEQFDNINDAAKSAAAFGVEADDLRWIRGGFEAEGFKGRNYVSIYIGDDEADKIRDLTSSEKKNFERAL